MIRKVVKDAPRPVIVAPATKCPDGPVLVAYDGSLQAARALAAFEATGLAEKGKVHLLSIGPVATLAAASAERALAFLRLHDVDAIPLVIDSSSPPATVILEQIGRLGAGLVVMGAYGQPILKEFVIGSASRTLLSESPVPLFLFH